MVRARAPKEVREARARSFKSKLVGRWLAKHYPMTPQESPSEPPEPNPGKPKPQEPER